MKNLQSFFIREHVIKSVRKFFDEQGFHEVTVPVLNQALPLEPNIYSFETAWNTNQGTQKLFLTTSPESGLKKMLALGIGNCYSIGKCFRNLESSGSRHNPEFLMLEWYRENAEYHKIMEDTENLVRFVKQQVDEYVHRDASQTLTFQNKEIVLNGKWPVLSLEKLLATHAEIELKNVLEEDALFSLASQKGYNVEGATWSQVFDQVVLNEVEPHFSDQPFFLTDFPARLSPLCKLNSEKPYLAERFEFFIARMEIGNGNNENTDVQVVKERFLDEEKKRKELHQHKHPIDQNFLDALDTMSDKPYAGIGLGIDRLGMLMANTLDIADVEYFSF